MSHLSTSLDAESVASLYGRVRHFIGRSVPNEDEASDLAQEAYLRLVRFSESREIENPDRLLFRIARNLLKDRFRRWKTRSQYQAEVDFADLEQKKSDASGIALDRVIDAREQMRSVEEAILHLPERCREVFLLSRFGGLSYAEIAASLDISQSTVEKHVARAILACREALDP